jgi:RimJ/RimL family protein N-acetyltransferase/nitrite reductase/ring-hydroxylating ferredoxin subunit
MPEPISPPKPPLSDGVVTLRPLRPDDVPAIVAACQDPEIRRWIPMIPIPYADTDGRSYVLMTLQAWHDGTSAEFAIADAATDRLIGSIGIRRDPNPRRHSIGYWVGPEARHRGVATRALRLVTRWGFEALGIERLSLWTLPGNSTSQAVAERAGFRYEGMVRNWESDRDGRPIDCAMYALTRDDLDEIDDGPGDASAAGAGTGSIGRASAALVPAGLHSPGTRTAPFLDLLAEADLEPASMRRVTIAEFDLLVAWTPDGIVVTDDRCPHMSAPLSAGGLEGCIVACPLHEGRFDLATGETVAMPTTGGLDADGVYHAPWSHSGATPATAPSARKADARRLTRVRRLSYYPARIRDGRLEAQVPIAPE